MQTDPDPLHDALLAELARRGVARSDELQRALGRSQPTLSRALRSLGARVATLGRQRSARYALPQPLRGFSGQQPLIWTDEGGRRLPWGTLTHLGAGRLHIEAPGVDIVCDGALPWFLTTLRLQGFLGRLWARSPAASGLDTNPERWRIDELLAVLLQQVHDLPGAIGLGEQAGAAMPTAPPDSAARLAQFDALADDLARMLPAGSSAAGEQAKFLLDDADGAHWLVKFSPPRGTPFGERWHDLLHAEAIALAVLAEHGVPVASARIHSSASRTYLASARFDRIGAAGRRHIVPLDAVHEAFVPGPRRDWAASCELLVRQRRLPGEAAAQARALLQFGRLIGNSDMHFGNLSVSVASPSELARGRFTLAPVYDMLPMRWRPDVASGELGLLPFTPEPADLDGAARPLAQAFWQRVAETAEIGAAFRALAATMARRLQG